MEKDRDHKFVIVMAEDPGDRGLFCFRPID
jgi:hypothetical protein